MNEDVSDIMRTSGREKYRVLATRGAATFLMLDGGTIGSPGHPTRPGPEDAALAASAAEIYHHLSSAEREAWPGGVALTLQMLAERSFLPPVAPFADAVSGDNGLFRALSEGRYVRVVNFHATPRRMSRDLEAQLSQLAENFAPVSHDELLGLVARGEWPHDRPGVILSFFDGFRDNYGVTAPILDRLGLTGGFFIVSGWLSTPERQRAFADAHLMDLPYDADEIPADGRVALSPEEVADLADRGHVIASHTRTHFPTSPGPAPEDLRREAAGSREDLEEISGTSVRALAWYAGMALGVNGSADAALREAGYDLLFANHAVQLVR